MIGSSALHVKWCDHCLIGLLSSIAPPLFLKMYRFSIRLCSLLFQLTELIVFLLLRVGRIIMFTLEVQLPYFYCVYLFAHIQYCIDSFCHDIFQRPAHHRFQLLLRLSVSLLPFQHPTFEYLVLCYPSLPHILSLFFFLWSWLFWSFATRCSSFVLLCFILALPVYQFSYLPAVFYFYHI